MYADLDKLHHPMCILGKAIKKKSIKYLILAVYIKADSNHLFYGCLIYEPIIQGQFLSQISNLDASERNSIVLKDRLFVKFQTKTSFQVCFAFCVLTVILELFLRGLFSDTSAKCISVVLWIVDDLLRVYLNLFNFGLWLWLVAFL